MSSMKVVQKADGWWLEIRNDGDQAADADIAILPDDTTQERALRQMEAFQKGNSDDIQELRGRNRALIEALESVAETMKSAIENYGK